MPYTIPKGEYEINSDLESHLLLIECFGNREIKMKRNLLQTFNC